MEKSSECYFLKWGSFRSEFADEAQKLLKEELMVDVTLAVDGKFLQAHKLVLSICSPYFKSLFKANPCKHPIVFIKDVKYDILNSLLEFMYKGEVGVKFEELPDFMNLGENLKIKGLAGKSHHKETAETSKAFYNERKRKNVPPSSDVEESDSEGRTKRKFKKISKRLNYTKRKIPKKKTKSMSKFNEEENDNFANDPMFSESGSDSDPLVKLVTQKPIEEINEKCDDMLDNNVDDSSADDHTPDFDLPETNDCQLHNDTADQGLQGVITNNYGTSQIWRFFQIIDNNSGCLLCGQVLKGKYHTNAVNHLKRKHFTAFSEYVRTRYEKNKDIAKFVDIFK